MIQSLNSMEEFDHLISNSSGILIYFSHEKCNVCKVLKPKVFEMLKENFPKMQMYYSNTVLSPEVAGQNSIFTVPTILIYFDGKEFLRKSRNISVEGLQKEIERPYQLLFD